MNFKKILVMLFFSISVTFVYSEAMSITVKKAQVRSSPSFISKVEYYLGYTDIVEILRKKNGWAFISTKSNSKNGWVHLSALNNDKLTLNKNASNIDSSASNNEVALAGKGFSSEVEESYKNNNNVDYAWIDKIELLKIDDAEMVLFLEEVGK